MLVLKEVGLNRCYGNITSNLLSLHVQGTWVVWTISMTTNMIFLSVQTLVIHGKIINTHSIAKLVDAALPISAHTHTHIYIHIACIIDPHRFRVWFHFSVQNVRSEQVKCSLNICYLAMIKFYDKFISFFSVSSSMW